MKNRKFIISALVCLIISAGCARKVVVARPAPIVEVIPVAPSPQHFWVKGHYVRRGRNYVWVPGYYIVKRRR